MQVGMISGAAPLGGVAAAGGKAAPAGKSFGAVLHDALNGVNTLQKQAEQASIDLAAGRVDDVAQVAIATEKASLALQLTIQVRNKVLDAYQEVMRMQV